MAHVGKKKNSKDPEGTVGICHNDYLMDHGGYSNNCALGSLDKGVDHVEMIQIKISVC